VSQRSGIHTCIFPEGQTKGSHLCMACGWRETGPQELDQDVQSECLVLPLGTKVVILGEMGED
jgi:hypothetical protein